MKCYILVLGVLASATAQQYTTPVPILKQINKHNEDGSYSYGYEAADGTFRIESKYPNGEVYGKYGYKDDAGKLREIEYGATNRGFEPQGNGITVPPPTLNEDKVRALGPNEEDDGQYREDPAMYNDERYNQNSIQQPVKLKGYQTNFQQPQYQQQAYQQPAYKQPSYKEPAYQQPSYKEPASTFNFDEFINQPFNFPSQPKYQQQYQPPSYQQQYQPAKPSTTYHNPQPNYNTQPSYFNPQPNYYNPSYNLQGNPVSNVNLDLGSYTVNYR